MASKKPMVIEMIVRTIGARLGLQQRPKFRDTTAVLGEWGGFDVEVQYDSAYLHGLIGPYWVRCELRRPGRTHCVVRHRAGNLDIVLGGSHETPTYSADLEFESEQEMEQVLCLVGELITRWRPGIETA